MNEFKPAPFDDDALFQVEHPEPERLLRSKSKVVTTETLTRATCRWPIGDPTAKDFHYCGDRPLSGAIYCDTHDAMSRPPVQRRR